MHSTWSRVYMQYVVPHVQLKTSNECNEELPLRLAPPVWLCYHRIRLLPKPVKIFLLVLEATLKLLFDPRWPLQTTEYSVAKWQHYIGKFTAMSSLFALWPGPATDGLRIQRPEAGTKRLQPAPATCLGSPSGIRSCLEHLVLIRAISKDMVPCIVLCAT